MNIIEVPIKKLKSFDKCYLSITADREGQLQPCGKLIHLKGESSPTAIPSDLYEQVFINTEDYPVNVLEKMIFESTFYVNRIIPPVWHHIGNIQILDFVEEFLVFIDWKYQQYTDTTLDSAVIAAIAMKYDGQKTEAPDYINRMIGLNR